LRQELEELSILCWEEHILSEIKNCLDMKTGIDFDIVLDRLRDFWWNFVEVPDTITRYHDEIKPYLERIKWTDTILDIVRKERKIDQRKFCIRWMEDDWSHEYFLAYDGVSTVWDIQNPILYANLSWMVIIYYWEKNIQEWHEWKWEWIQQEILWKNTIEWSKFFPSLMHYLGLKSEVILQDIWVESSLEGVRNSEIYSLGFHFEGEKIYLMIENNSLRIIFPKESEITSEDRREIRRTIEEGVNFVNENQDNI